MLWQEELASYLQTKFVESDASVYNKEFWLTYESTNSYCDTFKKQYSILVSLENEVALECIQDGKPFLNLKDKAHFEKCLI